MKVYELKIMLWKNKGTLSLFILICTGFDAYIDVFQSKASFKKYKCEDCMIREANPVLLSAIFLLSGSTLMRVNFYSF